MGWTLFAAPIVTLIGGPTCFPWHTLYFYPYFFSFYLFLLCLIIFQVEADGSTVANSRGRRLAARREIRCEGKGFNPPLLPHTTGEEGPSILPRAARGMAAGATPCSSRGRTIGARASISRRKDGRKSCVEFTGRPLPSAMTATCRGSLAPIRA